MSYKSIPEENGLLIIIENSFTDEMLKFCRILSEDPKFYDIDYIIIDLTKVKKFPIKSETINQLAVLDTELYKRNPSLKQALITNEVVMKGLTKMFQMYFEIHNNDETWDTKQFSNIEDARKWVDA